MKLMIDLSYKPKKKKDDEDEKAGIIEILILVLFAFLLWAVMTASFINGIY